MTDPPPRGPRCSRCGCTWVEHEKHVSDDWHQVAGRCLSCDCEGFTIRDRDVAQVATGRAA